MSEAIYRWLLRLYPERFRGEYGDEALQLFRDRFSNETGFFRRLRFWFDIIRDLLTSLPHEHALVEQKFARAPGFYVFEDGGPRREALLAGAVLSLLLFNAVSVAMMHGGNQRPQRAPIRGSLLGGIGFSQSRDASPRSFEVVSIKSNPTNGPALIAPPIGGRFAATRLTLLSAIRIAFSIEDSPPGPRDPNAQPDDSRILGGPAWIRSERFDIEGRAGAVIGMEQMKPMLQSLLEERFKLKLHREMRDMAIYALVVGKAGHKLQRLTDENGEPILKLPPPDLSAPPPPPPPPPVPVPGGPPPPMQALPPGMGAQGPGRIDASGWNMEQLALALSRASGRPVIDKTGLVGLFNLRLVWTPDTPNAAAFPDTAGPSLFTAVQEQLGLRLESQRGPIEFFIIDSAERPSEN